jgi:thiamine biosynthesis protein ThiS
MMRVTVNGEVREITPGLTILAFLEILGLNPRKVAVERNRAIVPKSAFGVVLLADDDSLEIVHFVGGG